MGINGDPWTSNLFGFANVLLMIQKSCITCLQDVILFWEVTEIENDTFGRLKLIFQGPCFPLSWYFGWWDSLDVWIINSMQFMNPWTLAVSDLQVLCCFGAFFELPVCCLFYLGMEGQWDQQFFSEDSIKEWQYCWESMVVDYFRHTPVLDNCSF